MKHEIISYAVYIFSTSIFVVPKENHKSSATIPNLGGFT